MKGGMHGYPSSYAIGHKALAELFLDPVLVEEKIDGSQFSFGMFPDGLRLRSKGAEIHFDESLRVSEKMFQRAVDAVLNRVSLLREGWTYRAEYLAKPKHNALAYDRIPNDSLIIFDIDAGEERYLGWDEKAEEAARIGLEAVPRLFGPGIVSDVEQLRALLDTVSVLGGQKIEGVVVKNYNRFGLDKKILIGKHVSEAYKEVHAAAWKVGNPKSGDIVQEIGLALKTPARWDKAVQHLRDAGRLEGSPRDIGNLFQEVPADIEKECAEEIKDRLYAWARPKIMRIVTAGLAEWYKNKLLDGQPFAPGARDEGGEG